MEITYRPESTPDDKKVAAEFSPDIRKDIEIKINNTTTIYVSKKKIKENGREYYYNKYKETYKKYW